MTTEPIATPTRLRQRLNALQRHREPGDLAILEARRDLEAAKLEQHIRDVVAGAPPLTAEQADRLRALLPGAG